MHYNVSGRHKATPYHRMPCCNYVRVCITLLPVKRTFSQNGVVHVNPPNPSSLQAWYHQTLIVTKNYVVNDQTDVAQKEMQVKDKTHLQR